MIDFYHKPNNIPNNYNIITCCAFLMNKPYKSSKRYYNGLNNLVDLINTDNNIFLYCYHDTTIEEPKHNNDEINDEIKTLWIPLLNKMKRSQKIFCIRYNFPDFKENDFYHISTFGTIVRFLPFFNLPEYNNVNIAYCTDLDFIQ